MSSPTPVPVSPIFNSELAAFDAIAIAKSVELLDISQSLAGLPFDPGAQAHLEGAMLDFQRAGRQRLDRLASDPNR